MTKRKPKKTIDQFQEEHVEKLERENKELKATNKRVLKSLENAKHKKQDLVNAVYQAVKDNLSLIEIPKVKVPPRDRRKGQEEIAIALLSDIQLAKVTPDYNTEIAEERVLRYADKIINIARIKRKSFPVKKVAVLVLGDIVEGELIFAGQEHLIDSSLYRQVTIDAPRIMIGFLDKLLAEFEEVDCHLVIGNHGALGGKSRRSYNPETNADRMLYKILELAYKDQKRISFNSPDGEGERNWYTVAQLGEKLRFFLFHGDQIRGFGGIAWYGYNKKILGWKALASNGLMEDFDYAVCGHYHTPTTMYINDTRVWVNGSTESYNTFAQEQLASMGRPCQFLLFGKDGSGVTSEYLINLEK
tara:strand:- start:228 stop:1304 length:1077 start_codon:yes stop_codon:yes gene_type:complete